MLRLGKTVLRGSVFTLFFFTLTIPQAKAVSLWPFQWAKTDFEKLKDQALTVLQHEKTSTFKARKALRDQVSSTLKFTQNYKGVEVMGGQALFHYSKNGEMTSFTTPVVDFEMNVNPKFNVATALKILDDRYQSPTRLTEAAQLKVFKDFSDKTHLVYHLKTGTTVKQSSKHVFLDAHTGEIILETPRECQLAPSDVYRADTPTAQAYVTDSGYPIFVNMNMYAKAISNGEITDSADRAALNAYQHAVRVYDYYFNTFGRRSYDDKDSPITSVVHAGVGMNNAFWSDEHKLIIYGDGDGLIFTDLTYGLDVAAHELTHGVTENEAQLVFAGESGALNESYSDFFAKMIDYTPKNWGIGAKIAGRALGKTVLRDLEDPERLGYPGSTDSPLKIPISKVCNLSNDFCGVHKNSGIPNRAAVLIVKAIGKEKTEKLYYNVLTQRLTATSNFRDARLATEEACVAMFGQDSRECTAVQAAFEQVKM